jgi:hypothetical protein
VIKRVVAIVGLALSSTLAHAGPNTDALASCLVQSSSKQDRITLGRWIFSAMAAHPDVADVAKYSPEVMNKTNKEAAEVFSRLLTSSCKEKAEKAFNTEGSDMAVQQSFGALGTTAGEELFSHPDVLKAAMGMVLSLDSKTFEMFINTKK